MVKLLARLRCLTCGYIAVRHRIAAFYRRRVPFCVNVLMARFNRDVFDGKQIPAKGAPCSAFGKRSPVFTMFVPAVGAGS